MTENNDRREFKERPDRIEEQDVNISPDNEGQKENAKNMNDPDARIFDEKHAAIHTQQGTVRPDSLLPVDAPEGTEQKTKADDYSDLENFSLKKPHDQELKDE